MRTLLCLAALSGCCLLNAAPLNAVPMTKGERQRLVSHLEMTEAWLKSGVNGLSKAQLEFKPTPDFGTLEK